ncbi:MAG: hypothetical protein UHP27_04655 [Muribaculaceae bacterium]|nr:hypothetical protein [Muribaculaceae bacterium]
MNIATLAFTGCPDTVGATTAGFMSRTVHTSRPGTTFTTPSNKLIGMVSARRRRLSRPAELLSSSDMRPSSAVHTDSIDDRSLYVMVRSATPRTF